MTRLGATCTFCGAGVWMDFRRHRLLDEDGARHQCPMPEVPDIRECICGALVSTLSDGRRFDFRSGGVHDCSTVKRSVAPVVRPVVVRPAKGEPTHTTDATITTRTTRKGASVWETYSR